MRKYLAALLVSFLLSSESLALVVVGYDGEPFYFKNGSEGVSGACYDILQEMCRLDGITCKFRFAQIPKMLEMLKDEDADIACPFSESADRRKYLNYSNKLFKTAYAMFGTPETIKKISSLKDLAGFSISVFDPSITSDNLHKLYEKVGKIFKIVPEAAEMTSLLKAEKVGKTLAYINRDIANHWIEKSRSNLKEVSIEEEDVYYYIAFSQKTIPPARLKKFMKHLEDLRTSKFLEKVFAKYNLQLAEEEPKSKSLKSESTDR